MPTRFDKYRFTKKTVLSDDVFNAIWRDIDLRLVALEEVHKDWRGIIEDVTTHGLRRIEEVLRPSFEALSALEEVAEGKVEEISELREEANEILDLKRDEILEGIADLGESVKDAITQRKNVALGEIEQRKNVALGEIEQKRQEVLEELEEVVGGIEDIQAEMEAMKVELEKLVYKVVHVIGGE